jgi:hypothetical protein
MNSNAKNVKSNVYRAPGLIFVPNVILAIYFLIIFVSVVAAKIQRILTQTQTNAKDVKILAKPVRLPVTIAPLAFKEIFSMGNVSLNALFLITLRSNILLLPALNAPPNANLAQLISITARLAIPTSLFTMENASQSALWVSSSSKN